jgi:opacity protein-like surface antigen
MKKVIFACAMLVATVVANAQTEKNTTLLGGSLSFNNTENISSFMANPNIGVFVANNFAVGGELSLYTSEGYTSWGVGPFARYYFGQQTKGKPYLGASLLVGGADETDTEVGFGAHGGYAFFLNKSVALQLGVQYNRISEMDQFGISAGFQIHFKK